MGRIWSKDQPLKNSRCGRPQGNSDQTALKRVPAGAATILIKVKTHRGDALNEGTDTREESEESKTMEGVHITKT